MAEKLFKLRWLIGGAVIALAVIFGVSGSSIGMWEEYLPECKNDGLLLGVPRYIRADEWALSTVISFGQTYEGDYGYFEDALRGESTDMVLASNAPVKGPISLTRIFSMGYCLFGINGGLAFFWVSRLVTLFLVTFQFFLLMTKGEKGYSLAGTLLVTFSAAIQWWFHTSALLECIVYGELAVLIFHAYFRTKAWWKRLAYAVVLGILGYAYALALYPAWQVPFVYVFLTLLLWQVYEAKTEGVLKVKKSDYGNILLAVAILALGLAYFLCHSAEGLAAVNGTEYPGARFVTGGGAGLTYFQYINSLFYPLVEEGISGNVSESAMFFDLFPLGILLAVRRMAKLKKLDFVLVGLLLVNLFFAVFCSVGIPAVAAKYSLMSNCPTGRVMVIFGYVNILLLIRSLALGGKRESVPAKTGRGFPLAEKEKKLGKRKDLRAAVAVKAVAAVVFAVPVCLLAHAAQKEYMQTSMIAIGMVVLSFLVFAVLLGRQWLFALFCGITVFFTGMLVNPVQKGADFIYDSPLIEAIARTNEDKGIWMVEGLDYPMNNVPLFVGASTINSTSYYPTIERWYDLDSDNHHNSSFVYNRYAHIRMDLVETGVSWFEQGIADDRIGVKLDIADVPKIGVDYILTVRELEGYSREGITFTQLEQVGEFRIYRVD